VVISFLLSANLIKLPCLGQLLNLSAEKARLGEVHYSARVVGTVPTLGDTFLVRVLAEGDVLRTVQVGVNQDTNFRVVQALQIVVEDSIGQLQEFTLGNTDAEWEASVEVPERVELVGFSEASGWWIDQIRFHFSDGSASDTFGSTAAILISG